MNQHCNGPNAEAIAKLTERERTVFQHIGKGQTTAEIAAELDVSSSTVETYRYRIKYKLGLENAAQLARDAAIWCHEHPE